MDLGTKLTDEQFVALPDEPGKRELLDGELITLPPVEEHHNQIAIRF
jgi:Uma2 family endonuclease